MAIGSEARLQGSSHSNQFHLIGFEWRKPTMSIIDLRLARNLMSSRGPNGPAALLLLPEINHRLAAILVHNETAITKVWVVLSASKRSGNGGGTLIKFRMLLERYFVTTRSIQVWGNLSSISSTVYSDRKELYRSWYPKQLWKTAMNWKCQKHESDASKWDTCRISSSANVFQFVCFVEWSRESKKTHIHTYTPIWRSNSVTDIRARWQSVLNLR